MTKANFLRILSPVTGLAQFGTPAASPHTVDLSTEGVAFAFDARTTDAITHLGFRYGSRTGTPPTFVIGLEGLSSTTGFPDGTYRTNGGNCTATFTPPASTAWDSTWQWIALDNACTPSLGERLCMSIRYSSGTIDASNASSFVTQWTNMAPTISSFPYAIRNTSGSWAVSLVASVFGVRTANDRYGNIIPNMYATRSAATIGHRQAMKVNIPSGFGDTYKVAGIRAVVSLAGAVNKTPLAKIWQGTTALASKSLDTEQSGSPTTAAYRTFECFFDTSVTLNCGTDYYFGYEVADTTNSGVLLYGTQFSEAEDNSSDGGVICTMGRFDGTSWTDDATVRPWMELILEDFTKPSGGGGGSIILPSNAFSSIGSF